ncbi:MAG: ATP-binding protein [Synechococcus sp.]
MTELLSRQAIAVSSLQVYRSVLISPVGQAWLKCAMLAIETPQQASIREQIQLLDSYGSWFQQLTRQGVSWTDWLMQELLQDDNPFSRLASGNDLQSITPTLRAAAGHDLDRLHLLWSHPYELSKAVQGLTGEDVIGWQGHTALAGGTIVAQLSGSPSWSQCLQTVATYYRENGVGLFGRYRAARWHSGEHQLQGVAKPDAISLCEIYGYGRQKVALCDNVEALLARQPALNVLLYGARGTGKSSLVKALLGEYGDRGLRIVELARSDLQDLLAVVAQLADLPQSFILFVDDLSFSADETDYKQLKVMLEGDIAARPNNVCLYATSNRRHLVKEYFADRPNPSNDEVHAWDTVQEKLSLSDRFGLTLTFPPFTQESYFATVEYLAQLRELSNSAQDLRKRALTWAQQQNGFSGRTARQFIDKLQRADMVITPDT